MQGQHIGTKWVKRYVWSVLSININNSTDIISSCLQNVISTTPYDWSVRYNGNVCTILNVDGSCIGNPSRAGFGGVIRNNSGNYVSGFSVFIYNFKDILLVELVG